MRQPRIRGFASAATGAALLFSGATASTQSSKVSGGLSSTYEPFKVTYATSGHPAGMSIPTNMRVATVLASPRFCKKRTEYTPADVNIIGSSPVETMVERAAGRGTPEFRHWWGTTVGQVQLPTGPAAGDVSTSDAEGTAAVSPPALLPMPLVPLQALTGHTNCDHDKSKEEDHQWTKFQQKPLLTPNQFLTRFVNGLLYLGEVITLDVVGAFLFGRWTQRYYKRSRKNRANRRRRRRLRRWSRFAARMCLMLRDAWPLKRAASPSEHKDPGQSVTECSRQADVEVTLPAGVSVAVDTPPGDTAIGSAEAGDSSAIIEEEPRAIVASREGPLESIASSAPIPLSPEPSSPATNETLIEAAASELPPVVGPLAPLPLVAVESTIGASPPLYQSIPDAALNAPPRSVSPLAGLLLAACETSNAEIPRVPAVSTFVSFVLPAAEPTTEPSLAPRQLPTEDGHQEVSISAERPSLGVNQASAEETADHDGHLAAVDASQRFRDEHFAQQHAEKLVKAAFDSIEEIVRKRSIFHAGFVAGLGHE